MEYLVMIAVLVGLMLFIFAREAALAKKRRRRFVQSLYDDFGKLPAKEHKQERFARVRGYYDRHRREGQIDDITWNDLNMDDVFQRLDYTFSATGEEYLYYTLRNTCRDRAEAEHLGEVAAWFQEHEDERVQVQLLMNELGYTRQFSLYDYIENLDYLGERNNTLHYILDALYLPLIALLPFHLSLGLLGLVALVIYQIVSYFKEKGKNEPYIISFFYVLRLLNVCRSICRIPMPVCDREKESMNQYLHQLRGVKGGSDWVFSSGQSKTTGNPLNILMDYVCMCFHLDLIIFNRMLAQLRTHLEEIDGLITQAGFLETAISVGAFRASLENGWCTPQLCGYDEDTAPRLSISGAYHPLLTDPVKNSVTAEKGVLLTGSNASGKSTFLKTVALNAILAQAIYTCTADSYRAPSFFICSSMSLRDDINSGESYYIVEIKAIKRILDAAETGGDMPVLCFVDEVLRGTNTVERIAASTQIMRSLADGNTLCFAATHDIELTELLADCYDNYHFEEDVQDGDILFNYKLLSGKATTRNAIRLLEIMGFEPQIIERAGEMARRFTENGIWRT